MRTLTILALLALPSGAAAQQTSALVEFDHATGQARLITTRGATADTSDLGRTPTVRLSRSVPVEVRVVNTNTALYQFSTESESAPLPELASLRSFMGTLGPYIPDLRSIATGSPLSKDVGGASEEEREAAVAAARAALSSSIESAELSLLLLDQALYGEGGLQDHHTATLLALENMRRGVRPEEASRPLRRSLDLGPPCGEQEPVRLPVARDLLSALTELVASSHALQLALADAAYLDDARLVPLQESAEEIARRAHAALTDFEPLVANAYRVERLVGLVAGACSHWSAGEASGSLTTGRIVEVHVEPRPMPETARVAELGARTFTVRVQPRPLLRPALGLAAVGVPDGRFARYGTRPVAGGFEIYESGDRDQRFSVGGTLGFTWPGLDRRDEHGMAVWLPEFLVTTGGATAFGVGSAVSWNFLKLGAGALWMKHSALVGTRPGEVVEDESGLRLTETYGSPKLYISLSVFDWAPLVDRLPG